MKSQRDTYGLHIRLENDHFVNGHGDTLQPKEVLKVLETNIILYADAVKKELESIEKRCRARELTGHIEYARRTPKIVNDATELSELAQAVFQKLSNIEALNIWQTTLDHQNYVTSNVEQTDAILRGRSGYEVKRRSGNNSEALHGGITHLYENGWN